MGVPRQFENLHAFVHVGLVGILVTVDLALAAMLLLAPLSRHLVEESGVHAAVELVHVHCIEAFLEAVPFGAQPSDGFLLLPALVDVAGVERLTHPGQHLVIELESAKQHGELLFQ
ncbi:MAG: hypothetical protein WBW81_10085 [Methylocella sp.]